MKTRSAAGPLGRIIAAAGLTLVLGSCGEIQKTQETTATTPGFGASFLGAMENQIVDPVPYDTATAPELDGDRAALAMQRYKTNTSVRPRVIGTSGAGGGGR